MKINTTCIIAITFWETKLLTGTFQTLCIYWGKLQIITFRLMSPFLYTNKESSLHANQKACHVMELIMLITHYVGEFPFWSAVFLVKFVPGSSDSNYTSRKIGTFSLLQSPVKRSQWHFSLIRHRHCLKVITQ